MKNKTEAIIITEIFWILFFVIIFINFDYTRTKLSLLAILVWCIIVLVIAQFMLSLFSKSNFENKYILAYILILVLVDQIVKAIVVFFAETIFVPLIPGVLSIKVILNRYQSIVLQIMNVFASQFTVAGLKIALLPIFWWLLHVLSKSQRKYEFKTAIGYTGIILISAAIVCTALDSLFYGGTPDYFYLIPLYSSVDLKDIYAFQGVGCIYSIILRRNSA